jgi:hypothetical protein
MSLLKLCAAFQVFENSIWLFFTHPFDVGDVIRYEDDRYLVKNIKMQFVSLERADGAFVTVPTSEMSTARIHNVTRCFLAHASIAVVLMMAISCVASACAPRACVLLICRGYF